MPAARLSRPGPRIPTPNGNYTSGKNMLRQFQVNIERYNKAHPDEAPLPRVTIHSLRRLWNSVGADAKVPQVHRMAIVGHFTVRSNDDYTQSLGGVDGELRDAIETVNRPDLREVNECRQRRRRCRRATPERPSPLP